MEPTEDEEDTGAPRKPKAPRAAEDRDVSTSNKETNDEGGVGVTDEGKSERELKATPKDAKAAPSLAGKKRTQPALPAATTVIRAAAAAAQKTPEQAAAAADTAMQKAEAMAAAAAEARRVVAAPAAAAAAAAGAGAGAAPAPQRARRRPEAAAAAAAEAEWMRMADDEAAAGAAPAAAAASAPVTNPFAAAAVGIDPSLLQKMVDDEADKALSAITEVQERRIRIEPAAAEAQRKLAASRALSDDDPEIKLMKDTSRMILSAYGITFTGNISWQQIMRQLQHIYPYIQTVKTYTGYSVPDQSTIPYPTDADYIAARERARARVLQWAKEVDSLHRRLDDATGGSSLASATKRQLELKADAIKAALLTGNADKYRRELFIKQRDMKDSDLYESWIGLLQNIGVVYGFKTHGRDVLDLLREMQQESDHITVLIASPPDELTLQVPPNDDKSIFEQVRTIVYDNDASVLILDAAYYYYRAVIERQLAIVAPKPPAPQALDVKYSAAPASTPPPVAAAAGAGMGGIAAAAAGPSSMSDDGSSSGSGAGGNGGPSRPPGGGSGAAGQSLGGVSGFGGAGGGDDGGGDYSEEARAANLQRELSAQAFAANIVKRTGELAEATNDIQIAVTQLRKAVERASGGARYVGTRKILTAAEKLSKGLSEIETTISGFGSTGQWSAAASNAADTGAIQTAITDARKEFKDAMVGELEIVRAEFDERTSGVDAVRVAAVKRADEAFKLLGVRSTELAASVYQGVAMRAFVTESLDAIAAYRAVAEDAFVLLDRLQSGDAKVSVAMGEEERARALQATLNQTDVPKFGAYLNPFEYSEKLKAYIALLARAYRDPTGNERGDTVDIRTRLEALRRRSDIITNGLDAVPLTANGTIDATAALRTSITPIVAKLLSVERKVAAMGGGLELFAEVKQVRDELSVLTTAPSPDEKSAAGAGDYIPSILRREPELKASATTAAKVVQAVRNVYQKEEKEFSSELKRKNEALRVSEEERRTAVRKLAEAKRAEVAGDRPALTEAKTWRAKYETIAKLLGAVDNNRRELLQYIDVLRSQAPQGTNPAATPSAGAAAAAAEAPLPNVAASAVSAQISAAYDAAMSELSADRKASIEAQRKAPFNVKAAVEELETKFAQDIFKKDAAHIKRTATLEEQLREKDRELDAAKLKASLSGDEYKRELKQCKEEKDRAVKDRTELTGKLKESQKQLEVAVKNSKSLSTQLDVVLTASAELKLTDEEPLAARAGDVKHGADALPPEYGNPDAPRLELRARYKQLLEKLRQIRGNGGALKGTEDSATILLRHYREMRAEVKRIEKETDHDVDELRKKLSEPLRRVTQFEKNVEDASAKIVSDIGLQFKTAVEDAVRANIGIEYADTKVAEAELFAREATQLLARTRFEPVGGAAAAASPSLLSVDQIIAAYNLVNQQQATALTVAERVVDRLLLRLEAEAGEGLQQRAERQDRFNAQVAQLIAVARRVAELILPIVKSVSDITPADPKMAYRTELGRFQTSLKDAKENVVLVWPTLSKESYSYIKELSTRAAQLERQQRRANEEAKRMKAEAKVASSAANDLRESVIKAMNDTSRLSKKIPLQPIGSYESPDRIKAVLLSWVMNANSQLDKAVRASAGSESKQGVPRDMMLNISAGAPPKSLYLAIVTFFKIVAGYCDRDGLDKIAHKAALPLSERRATTAAENALSAGVAAYLSGRSAAPDAKSAPESSSESSLVEELTAQMANAATFKEALQTLLTSQMLAALTSVIDWLTDVNNEQTRMYRGVPLSVLLTSPSLEAPLARLLGVEFLTIEHDARGSRTIADSRDASDRNAKIKSQLTAVLFRGRKLLDAPVYKFGASGAQAPEQTNDTAWMFERWESVPIPFIGDGYSASTTAVAQRFRPVVIKSADASDSYFELTNPWSS